METNELTPDHQEDRNARRSRACLWFLLIIAGGCLLLTVFRLLLQEFGFVLAAWQSNAAYEILVFTLIQCTIYITLIRISQTGGLRSDRAPRLILAVVPLLLWLNADRMLTLDFRARTKPDDDLLQTHPTRLWTHRANAVSSRHEQIYRTNSMGHRGPELMANTPANHKRIVVLGDSIAFGLYLAESETYTSQLTDLSAMHCPDTSIEWINVSVRGYSPFQQLDMLREQFEMLQPDMVIQTICLNDINFKFTLVTYGGLMTYVAERHDPSVFEVLGTYRVLKRLAARFIAPSPEALEAEADRYSLDRLIEEPESEDMRNAWDVTRKNLLETVAFARERNVPIAMVVFPIARQIGSPVEADRTPQARLRSLCNETGTPMLDLLPGYEALAERKAVPGIFLLPDTIHPTAEAMRESAVLTFAFLRETLLSEVCGATYDNGDAGVD
ncbi:MAG: SGNH/GDSL hydrolase family protein [Phycisphaerae bacterium]